MTEVVASGQPRLNRRRLLVLLAVLVSVGSITAVVATRMAPPGRAPDVLAETSGSGQSRTPSFSVKGPFTLNYQFECSTAIARGGFGTTGSFEATIRDAAGADAFDGQGVFDQGSAGLNSRTYPTGGTFYVDVASDCDWHVSVLKGIHPLPTPRA
ncbi:MAG: hypothetical protein ACYDGR_05195 [Candidatus Dormibacteria bacterium]